VVSRWGESSTVGVLGCFLICIALFVLAVWIAWTIMEASIPAEASRPAGNEPASGG
jgi:hypothetical protein